MRAFFWEFFDITKSFITTIVSCYYFLFGERKHAKPIAKNK